MPEPLAILLQYALPALIAGAFGWAAVVSSKSRDRKAAEAAATAAAESARINEQFPGWAELVKENRDLRAEMTSLRTEVDAIKVGNSRKMAAVTRILRQIAAQWPTEHGPDISPADIAELEDTEVIPPQWLRRQPSKE